MEKLQKRSNIARLEALSNALPVKWDFPRSKDIIKSQSMAVAFFMVILLGKPKENPTMRAN